jgi:hypothetical protein
MGQSLFSQQLREARRPSGVAELDRLGVTRGVRRGPQWQRVGRGLYVPAGHDLTTAQRIQAAVPALPGGGAVGGWAAAFVLGADWLDGRGLDGRPLPVPLCVGQHVHRRSTAELRYVRDRLGPADVGVRHGVPVTPPARTAFDVARWSDGLTEAVVALDAMAHFGLVQLSDVQVHADGFPRLVGGRQVRTALGLADAGVLSPWESRLRMVYVLDAGLPRPLVNRTLYDDRGRFIAIPDLLDVEAGLVLEYDGSGHRERRQHNADNVREEELERAGLIVVRADSYDYRHRRTRLVERVREARQRGLARDRRRDRWTLTVPEWALDPYESLSDEDKDALFGLT